MVWSLHVLRHSRVWEELLEAIWIYIYIYCNLLNCMQYRHSLQTVGVSAILLAKDFLKFNSSPSGWSLTGGPTVESYKSRHFRGRSKRVPQLGCFLIIPLSLAIQYQPVDQESFIREIQINILRQFLCVFIGPFQTTPSMVVISLNILAFFNVSFFIILFI